jgi:hypothetical protein
MNPLTLRRPLRAKHVEGNKKPVRHPTNGYRYYRRGDLDRTAVPSPQRCAGANEVLLWGGPAAA